MKRELEARVVAARLSELRKLCPEPTFASKVAKRLVELRALDDLRRCLERARIKG